ncbi:MAG: prolipoprotein diacylglyceryl transferase [Candidatus Omnitrophica bacterium]|nr:prolipoprotein diacylglyceryl transferase [Candidatus Omnitrophota bacterium]MCM8833151.1 prolipoprotein diacylglyceryl transferase [Candidatus Omnitrophota bacterium]
MCPVFIKIGSFVIYWYGVLVAIGVFVSVAIFQKESLKEGYNEKLISQIVFWTILTGIIGARFLHIFVNFYYYILHPLEILKLRNGGLAVEGAILFSLIFLILFSKIKNISTIKLLDTISISVPIGQAIGRIGCFLNGCCYGKETNFFFGVKFPFLERKVHPTELYYSFLYIILFFLLKKLSQKFKKGEGFIFSSYLIGFSLIRYFVDFLRGDLNKTSLGLYPTQIIAIIIFIIGGVYLVLKILKTNKKYSG